MIRGAPVTPHGAWGPPAAPSRKARRRPPWFWRLVAFAVLLVLIAMILQAVVISTALAPVGSFSPWFAGATATAALAASWVMMSAVESRPPAALGLLPGRRAVRDGLVGGVAGLVLVGTVCAGLYAVDWIGALERAPLGSADSAQITEVTLFLLFAAFTEEVAVRGYPFQVLAEALGPVVATLVLAAVFAGLHGWNPGVGWTALGNTFLAGILLGVAYWRTLSLWLVTGVHFAWNWTMGVGAGLPVSGARFGLGGATVQGPSFLTGGAYGPEGGLLLSLVTVAGIVWMVRTPRLSRDPDVVALGPLPCDPVRPHWPERRSKATMNDESSEDR